MSTAPVTPVPTSIVTTVEKDITWVRAHIILALVTIALLAGSIIGGVSLFESLIERHDERVAAAQQKKEDVDTAAQAALLAQLSQEHADNIARDTAQTSLISTLVGQMAKQHEQTSKQVATDATLDAQSAADRLIGQTKSSASQVTVLSDKVTMDLPLTRIVVADLDLLPQAQSDVTNLQGQLAAQTILTSDSRVEAATANKVIAADKTELIATIKADNAACDVRVDKQATKDRKRGFWASVASLVFGVALRSAI